MDCKFLFFLHNRKIPSKKEMCSSFSQQIIVFKQLQFYLKQELSFYKTKQKYFLYIIQIS